MGVSEVIEGRYAGETACTGQGSLLFLKMSHLSLGYTMVFFTTILCIECEVIFQGPTPSLATKEGISRAPAIVNSSLSGMNTSGTSEVQSDSVLSSDSTRAPHLKGLLGS